MYVCGEGQAAVTPGAVVELSPGAPVVEQGEHGPRVEGANLAWGTKCL